MKSDTDTVVQPHSWLCRPIAKWHCQWQPLSHMRWTEQLNLRHQATASPAKRLFKRSTAFPSSQGPVCLAWPRACVRHSPAQAYQAHGAPATIITLPPTHARGIKHLERPFSALPLAEDASRHLAQPPREPAAALHLGGVPSLCQRTRATTSTASCPIKYFPLPISSHTRTLGSAGRAHGLRPLRLARRRLARRQPRRF